MKILTFGELMLRLKTPEHLKILQADTFEASYGGAEANVAVSLATLGNDVSYVTKVPEHQVGQAAVNEIRRFGVDTSRVLRGGGRVGIYYFEKGTNIRPTSVVYDRAYSAIAMAKAEEFDWKKLLDGVDLVCEGIKAGTFADVDEQGEFVVGGVGRTDGPLEQVELPLVKAQDRRSGFDRTDGEGHDLGHGNQFTRHPHAPSG